MASLTVTESGAAFAEAAAARIAARVERAIADRGGAFVCLTGGSTPKAVYALLGDPQHPWQARIAWPNVHLFWGDERCVPPDHADSNFGMARRALIDHVPIPASQVHRMRGEAADPRSAAHDYDRELRTAFANAKRPDLRFDLMLLGIGEDAHIASIFPGSPLLAGAPAAAIDEALSAERAAAVWAPHLQAWRITLTPAAILDADAILMMATGWAKRDAIRAARDAPPDERRWPAQLLRAAGDRVEWLIDRQAAPDSDASGPPR